MKKKSLLLIFIAFFACHTLIGQVIKSVNVTTPGTLQELLTSEELSTVTYLVVTGTINTEDFSTMNTQMPSLHTIDMRDASTVGNTLPPDVFADNDRLNSVFLPDAVTSIGDRAFQGCNFLNNVLFPSSLVSIGNSAFQSTSITSLDFPSSLVLIGDQAFMGIWILSAVHFPSSLNHIGNMAFIACPQITSVSIPASVSFIGFANFTVCASLIEIQVDESNLFYSSEDGVLYNKDQTRILLYPENKEGSSYVIPVSVTEIGPDVFRNNNKIRNLVIPSTVTHIEQGAFYNCTGIDTLKVNSSVPVEISASHFEQLNLNTCVLFVPRGTTDEYRAATRWGSFVNIQEFYTYLYPSPSILEIGASEGSKAVLNVQSNIEWTVTTDQSWLMVSPEVKMNDDTIVFKAHANPKGFSREAMLTFADLVNGDTIWMMVTQLAGPGFTELSTDTIEFGSTDNRTSGFTITSNTTWTITSDQSWLHINPWHGTDNNDILLTADINSGIVDRSATVTISGANASPATIYVFQDAAPLKLELSEDSVQIGATEGSTTTFNIESNVFWSVDVTEEWLEASPGLGLNNNTIELTAHANPNGIPRNAIVRVSGLNMDPIQVMVLQHAGICTLELSEDSVEIEAAEGSIAGFDITSNAEWRIETNETWLNVSDTIGIFDGSILLTADANPSVNERVASVTVSVNGHSFAIIVTQQGGPNSIGEIDYSKIIVYPDAQREILHVRWAAGNTLTLFNLNGTQFIVKSLTSDHETLAIHHLPAGLYLVKIGGNTFKIIK